MIAGFITGLFVFGGIVVFFYLVLKVKVLDWYATAGSDINGTITSFLGYFSIDPASALGIRLTNNINTRFTALSSDIDLFVADYVPKFSVVIGAMFGGVALILNTIAGRIGGRFNKIDEIT